MKNDPWKGASRQEGKGKGGEKGEKGNEKDKDRSRIPRELNEQRWSKGDIAKASEMLQQMEWGEEVKGTVAVATLEKSKESRHMAEAMGC